MFYLSFMAVLTLVSNLLTDIMYAVVDPRVQMCIRDRWQAGQPLL